MKRLSIVLVVLGGLAGSGALLTRRSLVAERTTLTRLSPDESRRASLIERVHQADRNVQIRLETLDNGQTTTLFHSPDEGGPYGTERLIWSKDGTKLLMVGRHFFVKDDLFLDNGDQLYFLHDLPSGKSWCNSAEETGFPPLKAEQVQGIEFTEPVILKGNSL